MIGLGLNIQFKRNLVNALTPLQKLFVERVEADGGIVENESCIGNFNMTKLQSSFYARVIKDGGIVESLECITNF